MGRVFRLRLAGLALVFLAFHLPYLPASLEDLDSINFALGVRHFDVARHQPHPPGYPLFIAVAKVVHALVPSEATALGLVSVVSATLGIVAIAALFRRLDAGASADRWSIAAAAVAVTSPLYWFTAARPLSDTTGLAAALAVQAMTLGARSARRVCAASFCAGLAMGLRSQVFWLTVPLLIFRILRNDLKTVPDAKEAIPYAPDDRSHAGDGLQTVPHKLRTVLLALFFFIAGALAWAVPLVVVSGGPAAYWHALFDQGAQDIGNIQMLWTRHGARDVADALYFAFVAPWAAWPMASAVLVLAAAGLASLLLHARQTLAVVAVAFGPYLLFDLLFQETFTSRYALPLVIPLGYLAVEGAKRLPRESGLALAVVLAMVDAHAAGTSVAAYSRQKAPAFRLLDDLRAATVASGQRPVLAPDRRESLDLRRPIAWVGDAMPPIAQQLPAPPQHEWLEAVKYWNSGGKGPLWFAVDPMRTSIDLVQHGEPTVYRWSLPYPVLVSGVRPNEMDLYRVDRPVWYVGEGWALTPEAAGVADTDRRGPSSGPIDGWISERVFGGAIVIGGRNFSSTATTVAIDTGGRAPSLPEIMAPPGPFLRVIELPFVEPPISDDYVKLAVRASPGSRVAIEQFDATDARSGRLIFGFGNGWQEQEFNPRTSLRWRWLSERGEIQLAPSGEPMVLHLEGESPLKYFSRPSRLSVRAGDRVVHESALSTDFSFNVEIPASRAKGTGIITLETDQVFVPAERSPRSADRRHLGLRIFKCELRPSRAPAAGELNVAEPVNIAFDSATTSSRRGA